jgi:hypothetical protein
MKRIGIIRIIFLIILVGCHPGREINVSDGFESGKLSSIWGTERFLRGALEFQSVIVRSGKSAIKVTLHPGDQLDEEKGTILKRAELRESAQLVSREDSVYLNSFSLFLPDDFPVVDTPLVIAQWKQYCKSGNCRIDNPVIALRYEAGEFMITLKTDPDKIILYSLRDDIRKRWLNFRFQIRFSRDTQGKIEAWLNENEIIHYTGITAYSQTYGYPKPGYFYFKMGLYRDHMDLPMTIYIDDYRKKELPGLTKLPARYHRITSELNITRRDSLVTLSPDAR